MDGPCLLFCCCSAGDGEDTIANLRSSIHRTKEWKGERRNGRMEWMDGERERERAKDKERDREGEREREKEEREENDETNPKHKICTTTKKRPADKPLTSADKH